MNLRVHIKGSGLDERGELRDDGAECYCGMPVLVLGGKVLGPAELPPGSTITVYYRKANAVPARALIDEAEAAGYPITSEVFW